MAEDLTASISPEDRLRQAFDAYNRQDADALLAMVSDDVSWATDREPVHGKQELGSYWDRQWQRTKTHDHVLRVERVSEGMYAVTLDQVVRSLDRVTLSTGRFVYEFMMQSGQIERLLSITAAPA